MDTGYEIQKLDRRTWVTVARGDDLERLTTKALKIAKQDRTDVRVRDYGKVVVFTAYRDGAYSGRRAPDADFGDGEGQ